MTYTFKHGDRPLSDVTVQRGVGRGGFGEVYYAVTDGGREIALKYLRDNPEVELRGVAACMNLKSPHLVSIFDVRHNDEGEYFVVMEYISGPSLRDMLVASPRGLGVQQAAFLFAEIGKGLAYLHDRGIVHRDLKPGNIFFDDGYVKIGDYGLSKYLSISRHSAQTSSVGTVHYMAPEVGSGNYTKSIDIYALGVILYEMLLGKVPFEGGSMGEVLMKHLTAQPEIDQLPAPFGDVIRKALAKDPQDRYADVSEMIAPALGATDICDSLRGFDPKSLYSIVPEKRFDPLEASPQHAANRNDGPQVRRLPTDPQAGAATAAHVREEDSPQLSPEAAAGDVRYASFWLRFGSAVIDAAIVGAVCAILVRDNGNNPLYLVASIMYNGLMVGWWNGQTIGKRVCGIKVIAENGDVCSKERSFGRAFAEILSFLTLCIGYLMAGFDPQRRALHDRVAGTRVVYALVPQPFSQRQASPRGVPARNRAW